MAERSGAARCTIPLIAFFLTSRRDAVRRLDIAVASWLRKPASVQHDTYACCRRGIARDGRRSSNSTASGMVQIITTLSSEQVMICTC